MIEPDGMLDLLAQRLGSSATVSTVFGAPVDRGDLTVIPVAKATYAFGGGSGSANGHDGTGGGGGVRVVPVGYIEIRQGVARYRPIREWAALIAILAAGSLGAMAVARGISRLRHG
jgi:uncharacterized spore protein YtfJ